MSGTVAYLYPNGPLAPTQAQMDHKYSAVHCIVTLSGGAGEVDVIHNLQFDPTKPVEDLQLPLLIINAVSGTFPISLPTVAHKDGNTLTLGALPESTAAVYDVWIFRHVKASGFFGL